jgi:hypothetical protein
MSYPTQADIKALVSTEGQKLSLTLPTHRHDPLNRGDKILAENMVRDIKKFYEEKSIGDPDQLVSKLESLVQATDWQQTRDGIVYLVSKNHAQFLYLDHQPQARFNLGENFLIIDLCRHLAESPAINVLLLSEFPTRYFYGKPMELVEVDNDDFPVVHEGPGGLEGLPTGFGQMTSIVRDENHRKFFRGIESAVIKQLQSSPGPLFLLGVVRYLSFWKEVAPQIEISGELAGSFDKYSVPQIQDFIRPLVDEFLLAESRKIAKEVDGAFSQKMVAQLSELAKLASESRLAKIVVDASAIDLPAELELAAWKTLATGGAIEFINEDEFPAEAPALGLIRF